jgi:hypothetical protein
MTDKVAADALAETFRTMMRHEAEQTHRRISWLSGFQGFLFAALGVSWGKDFALTQVLAGLGLAVAVLVFSGIIAAIWGVDRIRADWLRTRPKNYTGPDITGFYPDKLRLSVYLSPESLLSIVFAVAWIQVLRIA